jgi:hypothetical protein
VGDGRRAIPITLPAGLTAGGTAAPLPRAHLQSRGDCGGPPAVYTGRRLPAIFDATLDTSKYAMLPDINTVLKSLRPIP